MVNPVKKAYIENTKALQSVEVSGLNGQGKFPKHFFKQIELSKMKQVSLQRKINNYMINK